MADTFPLEDAEHKAAMEAWSRNPELPFPGVGSQPMDGQPPNITGANPALPPDIPTSGPSVSGGNGTEPRTPVGDGTNESQAGGPDLSKDQETPEKAFKKKFHYQPREMKDIMQESLDSLNNARKNPDTQTGSQATQIAELQKSQGADGEKGMEQLQKIQEEGINRSVEDGDMTEAEGKKMKKWAFKNIYNTIPKNEMSLFLIDFGFRAMMAGETMGSVGAIGAAGSGALGALQGRQRQASEDRVADTKYASEHALETFKAESGRMGEHTDRAKQEASAASGSDAYSGKDAFLLDYYRSQNMSEDDIRVQISGGRSPEETYDKVSDDVSKMVAAAKEDPPMIPSQFVMVDLGDGKPPTAMHLLTPTQEAKLARLITEERLSSRESMTQGRRDDAARKRAREGQAAATKPALEQ